MDFVHLHVHSNFSFKDAPAKPEAIVQAAAAYTMPAVALTDHNNLCGAVRFYHAARSVGVKNPKTYLRRLCMEHMALLDTDTNLALIRLNHELEIINLMGFNEYFLVENGS
jgi:DNA polymerase III alpha subunit